MRPLSTLGLAQAQSLVTTLAADDITEVWCSPSVRCRCTVEPLAAARGLNLRTHPRLSRTTHPTLLLSWLQQIGADAPWVVCTHRDVLTALYTTAHHAGITEAATRTTTAEGALWRVSTHPHRPYGPTQLAYTPPPPPVNTPAKRA